MLKNKKNKLAFTLMEIMVSIAILGIISSAVFTVFSDLFYGGKKDKIKIEMNAEIVDAIAIVKKYIKSADELKILDSNIKGDNLLGKKLNGILIKNKNPEIQSSLFTLIKPLEKELSGDFGVKTVGDKNFHLGITDLNLFSDIVKFGDKIIFSDPGGGNIWIVDSDGKSNMKKLLGGDISQLLTPTGLYLAQNNLFISDTYQNLIFSFPVNKINSGNLFDNNNSLKIIAGKKGFKNNKDTGEIIEYVVSGFKDGRIGYNTLNHPKGMALYDNNLYFADSGNNAVRVINLKTLNIDTFIGNGEKGMSEDGVFHSDFLLNNPSDLDIYVDKNKEFGMLLVSDTDNNRIVSSGPFSGYNSYSKPFTIVGIGKKDVKNLADGFFNLTDKFTGSKDEIIEKKENIGKIGFGGDFFLANNATLNHPTGIKFFGTGGFIFSDSGNNLIRRVSVFDAIGSKKLSQNINRIQTVIGNSSEVIVSEKEDNGVMDIKISTSAPESKNLTGSSKTAFLDNPTGLIFSGANILFNDLFLTKKKLFGKINLCKGTDFGSGSCLEGGGNIEFLNNRAFNALNLDKISITNLGDFISKKPLNVMQFTENNFKKGGQKIISIYLKFIDYLKVNDDIFIDIKTSVENRKIK